MVPNLDSRVGIPALDMPGLLNVANWAGSQEVNHPQPSVSRFTNNIIDDY